MKYRTVSLGNEVFGLAEVLRERRGEKSVARLVSGLIAEAAKSEGVVVGPPQEEVPPPAPELPEPVPPAPVGGCG